jgi:hypothetical protein
VNIHVQPSVDIPAFECPGCHKLLDGTIPVELEGPLPVEGSVSICGYCGSIAIFDGMRRLRTPTREERDEVLKDLRTADPEAYRFVLTSTVVLGGAHAGRPTG